MNAKTLFVIAAIALTGCTGMAKQQRMADFDACLGYGLNYGTPPFGLCMQQQALAHQQERNTEIMWVLGP